MVSQHCISYVICLIASHFGDVAAKVCECLIHHGPLSIFEIAGFTEMPHIKVENCLVALIQHNCVEAFSVPKIVGADVTNLSTKYAIVLDNIIHRMRFLKFCLIVKEHLGNQCAELLEGFLQHGSLTFESLCDRASGLNGGKVKRDYVLGKFSMLVLEQYVERCQKGEHLLKSKSDEVSSIRKCIKPVEQTGTVEQEAISAVSALEADRFSEIMDLTLNIEADVRDVNNGHSLDVSAGNKRKHEAVGTDEIIQNKIKLSGVLWRVNYEKFVHCLKKKTCVANVNSRFGLDAAIVLEAMIESNNPQNVIVNSATTSINRILESLRGKCGGISLTLELVHAILEQLDCQLCPEDPGSLYTCDLNNIIEACQHDKVESFILKKYGKEAYRIFRFLIKVDRRISLDQISDKTFIEKMEAQKVLCELWKDGYLEMEKVNLDFAARSKVFLWKVKKKILWEHVLNDMFYDALNICQKISQVTEECQVSNADAQKAQRLKRTKHVLENSLSKIDDAIMLFHDF